MRKFLPIAIYICIIAITSLCILSMPDKISEDEAENTSNAVYYAVIRYYVAEGCYPQTIDELDGYGLHYNRDRFIIGYQNLGSNIIPDITIMDRGKYEG